MDLDPILSALSKLEQSINNRYTDLNDKYQLVHTQLDALNVKLDNYPDKFQQVNTKLEEFNNKITILNEKVDSILSIANCDKSLDLLGSDPIIEREQRAKQQYFTYWLLGTCKDKTRLVTKCF
jgi:uncharacterized coiled-coil DUF342 family protein